MFYPLPKHLIVEYNQLSIDYSGMEMIFLKQLFSNLKVFQTHLKGLLKMDFWVLPPAF